MSEYRESSMFPIERSFNIPTEELNALVGEIPVIISPVELLGDVATGLE